MTIDKMSSGKQKSTLFLTLDLFVYYIYCGQFYHDITFYIYVQMNFLLSISS